MRDVLLNKHPEDYDLACALSAKESAARLRRHGIHVVESGVRHGTIIAVVAKHNIQITSFRVSGAARRKTRPATIIADLAARDFTINAMAYSLEHHELIDPHGGLRDLQRGVLRAVGDPAARYQEDPLRILRMVRFGPAQKRKVEKTSLAAARANVKLLKNVSPERIRLELIKILLAPAPAAALRLMQKSKIIDQILPELLPAVGFAQNIFHPQDVFEHTLSVIEKSPPDPTLRLAALFHDLGKPHVLSTDTQGARHFYEHEVQSAQIAKTVMERLKFSKEQIKEVSTLVRLHMRPLECGPSGVRRLMRELGPYFDNFRRFKIADAPPLMPEKEFKRRLAQFDKMVQEERARIASLESNKLAINGHDLIALGLTPGVKLGQVLKSLEDAVVDDPQLNQRDVLLERARQMIGQQ